MFTTCIYRCLNTKAKQIKIKCYFYCSRTVNKILILKLSWSTEFPGAKNRRSRFAATDWRPPDRHATDETRSSTEAQSGTIQEVRTLHYLPSRCTGAGQSYQHQDQRHSAQSWAQEQYHQPQLERTLFQI